jgi:hypothetical protein
MPRKKDVAVSVSVSHTRAVTRAEVFRRIRRTTEDQEGCEGRVALGSIGHCGVDWCKPLGFMVARSALTWGEGNSRLLPHVLLICIDRSISNAAILKSLSK